MRKLVAAGSLLALLLVSAGLLAAPKAIEEALKRVLAKSCPRCELDKTEIEFLDWGSRAIVKDLRYQGAKSDSTEVDVKIPKLEIHWDPTSYLSESPTFHGVALYSPVIEVTERADRSGSRVPEKEHWLSRLPAARVNGVKIHNGSLTYTLKVGKEDARIHITQIEGKISPFGTRESDSPKSVRLETQARLEKSGIAKIEAKMDLFAKKNHDQILIEVRDQDLSEIDFFQAESGVVLAGNLEIARADMKLSQGQLSGAFTTRYQDLKIDLKPGRDRKKVENFLTELVQDMAVKKTRPSKPGEKSPVTPIAGKREVGEPVTRLILRATREAAMKILIAKEKKQI